MHTLRNSRYAGNWYFHLRLAYKRAKFKFDKLWTKSETSFNKWAQMQRAHTLAHS